MFVMKIDQSLLDSLSVQAAKSSRLRQAYDLRTSSADQSQRILNALEPGTVIPIHRHRATAETLVMVRGRILQRLYNDSGELEEVFEMSP